MAAGKRSRFVSQVQLRPVETGVDFKKLKTAVKKNDLPDFQLNSLGGPLDPGFKDQ